MTKREYFVVACDKWGCSHNVMTFIAASHAYAIATMRKGMQIDRESKQYAFRAFDARMIDIRIEQFIGRILQNGITIV